MYVCISAREHVILLIIESKQVRIKKNEAEKKSYLDQ